MQKKLIIQLHKSTCITFENLFQRNCHRVQRHISFQQVTKDVESQDQSQNHVESSYFSFSRRRIPALYNHYDQQKNTVGSLVPVHRNVVMASLTFNILLLS